MKKLYSAFLSLFLIPAFLVGAQIEEPFYTVIFAKGTPLSSLTSGLKNLENPSGLLAAFSDTENEKNTIICKKRYPTQLLKKFNFINDFIESFKDKTDDTIDLSLFSNPPIDQKIFDILINYLRSENSLLCELKDETLIDVIKLANVLHLTNEDKTINVLFSLAMERDAVFNVIFNTPSEIDVLIDPKTVEKILGSYACRLYATYRNTTPLNQLKKIFGEEKMALLEKKNIIPHISITTLIDSCVSPHVINDNTNNHGTLNLANLGITSLEGLDCVPGIENVQKVLLNENQLKKIPSNTFTKFKQLTLIFLFNNNIKKIEEGAFSDLPQLKYVYLLRNPLAQEPEKATERARITQEVKQLNPTAVVKWTE